MIVFISNSKLYKQKKWRSEEVRIQVMIRVVVRSQAA